MRDPHEAEAVLDAGRRVLDAEAAAITQISLGEPFVRAVELIAELDGRLIVSGIGKSGLIGAKLAATFASTGTPAHFLHATEAMHGDLGSITPCDAVLLLSFSGKTDEVLRLSEAVTQMEVPRITLTKCSTNPLAKGATVSLEIGEVTEASPLESAPTASAAATLALGDALALAVSRYRGFDHAAFHRLHPEGRLGRELMPVMEVIRFRAHENLPLIPAIVPSSARHTSWLGRPNDPAASVVPEPCSWSTPTSGWRGFSPMRTCVGSCSPIAAKTRRR